MEVKEKTLFPSPIESKESHWAYEEEVERSKSFLDYGDNLDKGRMRSFTSYFDMGFRSH